MRISSRYLHMESSNPIVHQKQITLPNKGRGCHLITKDIVSAVSSELGSMKIGVCSLLCTFPKHVVKHTSASIAILDNTDPSFPQYMESTINKIVPEGYGLYQHSLEGEDDMPAHAKSVFLGDSHDVPVTEGKLNLGSTQGIFLCEHRTYSSSRTLVITLNGLAK
eukprot:TRINITY_DN1199_c0_g1_i14.p1 TRINITY_DN1199_c0_g1~~TRINITY_DN1199_c0_g1_i14.p1  ORF type:complete len:165 (+),score=26.60 TRINITY_DN1199_c0_g1_i14:97-591(+)